MEMRTVYRYEDASGRGPYRGHGYPHPLADMCDSHAGSHHPTWGSAVDEVEVKDEYGTYWAVVIELPDDIGNDGYLAACDSRESLDAWFNGWHDKLAENGFKVVEYTVPAENVVDGKSGLQVAFLPDKNASQGRNESPVAFLPVEA